MPTLLADIVNSQAMSLLKSKVLIGQKSAPPIEAAYEALVSGTADAAVFDAPVILYFAEPEEKGRVLTTDTF